MNGCVYCTDDGRCQKFSDGKYISFCVPPCNYRTPSNGDKIRAMTDKELAKELSAISGFAENPEDVQFWEHWLEQEAT